MTQLYVLTLSEAEKLSDTVARRLPKRAARAERMRSSEGKAHCLGAGALLAYALNLNEDQIETSEFGKPFAPTLSKSFNLSHSGEYVVLAVSNGDVGVDVQQLGTARSRVAQRCYTADELAWIETEIDRNFFTVWALKESVVKAVGKGLYLPLQNFSVLPLMKEQSIRIEGMTLYGQVIELPDHALAVCSTEPLDAPIQPILVTASEMEQRLSAQQV